MSESAPDCSLLPDSFPSREEADAELDRLGVEWLESDEFSPELYRALAGRVGVMATHVANKFGLPWLAPDIRQESITLFLEKGRWRPEEGPLAPYLYGFVRRVGLKMGRAMNPVHVVSVDNWHDFTEHRLLETEDELDEVERAAEGVRRAELARKFDLGEVEQAIADLTNPCAPTQIGGDGVSRASSDPRASSDQGKKKTDRRHRRGNLRLEEIRIRAALSRREIATGIGMSEWEYQAFETGKRAHTPRWVYEAARRFAENARPPWDFAWLHIASGNQIVSEWERLMGVDHTDPLMRRVIGVGLKTLQQWYNATEQTPRKSLTRQGRAHDRVLSYVEGDSH